MVSILYSTKYKLNRRMKKLTRRLTRTKPRHKKQQYGGAYALDELKFEHTTNARSSVIKAKLKKTNEKVGTLSWGGIQDDGQTKNEYIFISNVLVEENHRKKGICQNLIYELMRANPNTPEVRLNAQTTAGGIYCYITAFANSNFTNVEIINFTTRTARIEKKMLTSSNYTTQPTPYNDITLDISPFKARVISHESPKSPKSPKKEEKDKAFLKYICDNYCLGFEFIFTKDIDEPTRSMWQQEQAIRRIEQKNMISTQVVLARKLSYLEERWQEDREDVRVRRSALSEELKAVEYNRIDEKYRSDCAKAEHIAESNYRKLNSSSTIERQQKDLSQYPTGSVSLGTINRKPFTIYEGGKSKKHKYRRITRRVKRNRTRKSYRK